jgi:hypothetical protein
LTNSADVCHRRRLIAFTDIEVFAIILSRIAHNALSDLSSEELFVGKVHSDAVQWEIS